MQEEPGLLQQALKRESIVICEEEVKRGVPFIQYQ